MSRTASNHHALKWAQEKCKISFRKYDVLIFKIAMSNKRDFQGGDIFVSQICNCLLYFEKTLTALMSYHRFF